MPGGSRQTGAYGRDSGYQSLFPDTGGDCRRNPGCLIACVEGERIDAIYFYGAGCAFPEKNRIVEEAITPYIPAPIEVYSDLMAAARALCGSRPGIACILGTGSNSCLYDGTEITEHISPLGFILGMRVVAPCSEVIGRGLLEASVAGAFGSEVYGSI